VILGFHHEVDEICSLLGYYAVYGGNYILMFWDNLLVPYSRVRPQPGILLVSHQWNLNVHKGLHTELHIAGFNVSKVHHC